MWTSVRSLTAPSAEWGVGADAGNVPGFVKCQGRTGERQRYGNHCGSDNILLRAEAAGRECQVFLLQQDDLMGIEFCRTDAVELAVREQLDGKFDLEKRDADVNKSIIECHG